MLPTSGPHGSGAAPPRSRLIARAVAAAAGWPGWRALSLLAACGSSGARPARGGHGQAPPRARAASVRCEAGASCSSQRHEDHLLGVGARHWPGGHRVQQDPPAICVTLEDVGRGRPRVHAAHQRPEGRARARPTWPRSSSTSCRRSRSRTDVDNLVPYGANKYKSDFAPWAWKEVSQGSAVYAMPSDAGPMAFLLQPASCWPSTTSPRRPPGLSSPPTRPACTRPTRTLPDQLLRRPTCSGCMTPDGAGQRVAVHLHRRQHGRPSTGPARPR